VADEGCILCRIDTGKPAVKKIYEDDLVYAMDMPEESEYHRAPVHFMVIPHKHVPSALQMTPDDAELGGGRAGVGELQTATELDPRSQKRRGQSTR